MPEIEIFRPGRHRAMSGETLSFSAADLDAIVAGYDPAVHEAPVVVGHPRSNDPAYGWVKALRRDGRGLKATIDQLEPTFAEMVRTGRFKKVSASFYPPSSPSNPTPGRYHLRHIGFLGAQPPAVKGMAPVELSEDTEVVTVEFAAADEASTKRSLAWALRAIANAFSRLRDQEIADSGDAAAGDDVASRWQIDEISEAATRLQEEAEAATPNFTEPQEKTAVTTPTPSAPAAADTQDPAAALEARERDLKQREAQFAERERAARRADNAAFLDGLVADGRPLPCAKETLAAFMEAIDGASVDFGEGEGRDPLTVFKEDVLGRLPKRVEFAELAAPDGSEPAQARAEDISRRAIAFQEEQRRAGLDITVTQAVGHIVKEMNQ
ncbi:hypothetical protein [Roseospirillum parvum]|uniref:Mu-like prophage I protein n=1 Tax=Roseospirillum parvum TaxID=83401 RepID=A0A1G8GD51_9PROT|nr:hypothetical protein [Roseospirillum parvum]SDH92221.1 hypothetical protein SAMN05421742_1244 [Roseospirillum parvum]